MTATDVADGDLSSAIQSASDVDATSEGSYSITYSVSDAAGNLASIVRTVIVKEPNLNIAFKDSTPTLWENEYTHKFHFEFVEDESVPKSLQFSVSALSTAEVGFDFELLTSSVDVPSDENGGFIELSVLNDIAFEGSETIVIDIVDPKTGDILDEFSISLSDESSVAAHNDMSSQHLTISAVRIDDELFINKKLLVISEL